MKLLYISNLSNGVSSFSLASVLAARSLGYKYYLAANFSGTDKEKLESDEKMYGVHFCQLDLARSPYSKNNIKAYKQLVELIKSENIDCIHCNTPVGGLLGRLAGAKCGVKRVIYQAHGFHFYEGSPKKNWLVYYPVEKWMAKKTDALLTINQEDYKLAIERLHMRKNGKIYYVPGVGIDLSLYTRQKDKREKHRSEIGLKETDVACIAMGDLIPRKNYGVSIEAISVLGKEFPALHFAICGNGPELESLQKLSQDKNVEDRIHFLGYRTDVKELLQAADVFFFTSLQEGLPRSTMEAMASGLPVACSNIRGNTDLIDEGKGGVLFNPKSLDDVVKRMRELLSSDFKSMGEYNLEHIKEFSLGEATKSLSEVYQTEFWFDKE